MSVFAWLLLSVPATALAVHLVSCLLAYLRFRKSPSAAPSVPRPGVSVIRPLCGLEPFSDETLRSTFLIDYPAYEVIFCVAKSSDPILPLVRALLTAYPEQRARVLIGEDAFSANPKLNNMAKGFRAACFEHIVFVDSNVFMPTHYLDDLAGLLSDGAGMVSAPPVGLAPDGFWAEVECAFLNSYQARIQYALDSLGLGFAQGKTLCFRRADLDHGGFARLASEPAEDAAATKMMRARGSRVRLAGPFPQLIGPRSASQVWKRQVRWARLRRASFPGLYMPEFLAGGLPPLLVLCAAVAALGCDVTMPAMIFAAVWYMPELLLVRAAGWPRTLPALLLRDALLPAVYVAGLLGSSFEWHGHRMVTAPAAETRRWTLSGGLSKLRGFL